MIGRSTELTAARGRNVQNGPRLSGAWGQSGVVRPLHNLIAFRQLSLAQSNRMAMCAGA